ncbi:MAG: hypothetical protein NC313_14475, partial [Butyrivibrio sp.]|nr:hypothetical protein [Butyrivibrio sp.]
MERDFEKEFKQLKQSETPDLWNRIEAGLSERKVTAFEPDKTNTSTMKATTTIVKAKADTSEPGRKAGVSIRRINAGKWGTLAAACVCAAIIIPALSLAIRNGGRKNNMSGGMPQTDMSASPAMDTAAQSAADNGADSNTATGAAADGYAEDTTVTTEETAEEYEKSDGAESTAAAGATADVQNTPQEDSVDNGKETEKFMQSETEESTENDALNSTDATLSAIENGQVIENVTVEIKEIVETSGQETIYQAVVVEQDNDAVLAKDMQIEIICDSDTEYISLSDTEDKMLKENEKYDISLRIENGRYIVTCVLSV